MIGYLIQQELRSFLPPERQVATLLTMAAMRASTPKKHEMQTSKAEEAGS